MGPYIVDSNFFIQAHRVSYPLDIAVSFWNKVIQLATEHKIISIDKVRNEIYQNEDDLKHWCMTNLPGDFFQNSSEVIAAYSRISNWTISMRNHYLPKAIDEFLNADEADAWLISYALANNNPIVTYEVSNPNIKSRIKIPDVCIQFGVQYTNTMNMFRQLGEQF